MNPRARSPAWNLPVLAADDAPVMPSAPFPALPKEMIIIWPWLPHTKVSKDSTTL